MTIEIFSILRRAAFFGAGTLFALAPAALTPALAQEKDDDTDEPETIEKKTEAFDKAEGLFEFYTDPESGDVYMEVSADQLGKEYIAFSYTENGVLEAGHFRGAYRDQRVLSIRRYYDRLEFVEENTSYYFDENSALARAREANISPAVLASLDIEATTEGSADDEGDDRFLVKVNDLFLSEKLHKVSPGPNPDAEPGAFSVGSLASDRTKFADIRSYPENVDIIVDYVFENPAPVNGGAEPVTDARAVTVTMQHSLIAMPDDEFEPRLDDYRVGYFFDQVTDLTSDDAAPYRDLINRWRLVKQDPSAELSDPVEPIVWWIENTTPRQYRDTIRDAVLAWNEAFEKAGFSNAVVVREQPDDADWDAGDIRYNVLRWTSSPIPPFGGYGPSFTNPRTGEILGADIMLEYTFIANRDILTDVFEEAALPAFHAHADPRDKFARCEAGRALMNNARFGVAALQAAGAGDDDIEEMVRQGIYYLMLHEVGHTLGLNHNMKASVLYGPEEVHDPAVTRGAPTASVMDYPAVNIAPDGVAQGDYYHTRPGPYDQWAIEFGYRPDLDEAARTALLARSTEPGNIFGNDADDMRAPGLGIDPRVMINDMSSDPVAYGVDRIELVQATLPKLLDKFDDEKSWQALLRAYLFATGQHAAMAQVISRQVGGVYVDRIAPGQSPDVAPYRPVPRARQKAAMDALATYVFAPDAFDAPTTLLNHLQAQRRGFNFFGQTEDPKIHDRALQTQLAVLDHLTHPNVLQRMIDASLYGNEYSPTAMLKDLNDAIYGGDLTGAPNAFRRNLQIAYLERLVAIVDNPQYAPAARGAALAAAEDVRGRLGLFGGMIEFGLNAETKAHRAQIKRLLRGV